MIYLLSRIGKVHYDEYAGKVIRASSKTEARKIANINTGGEGKIWENPKKASCELVNIMDGSEVILESYKA